MDLFHGCLETGAHRYLLYELAAAVGGTFRPKAQLALRKNMMNQGLKIFHLLLVQRWLKCRTPDAPRLHLPA